MIRILDKSEVFPAMDVDDPVVWLSWFSQTAHEYQTQKATRASYGFINRCLSDDNLYAFFFVCED